MAKKQSKNKKSAQTAPNDAATSPWSPFAYKSFAILWSATLISNVGTWMHDVAAGWLMTTLTTSPFMVAMVQTATTLPVFFLALPAGAFADIFDRRRLLISVSIFLALCVCSLGFFVTAGSITPGLLIVFTLLVGVGTAFLSPTWHAVVPQLVPKSHLQQAVALNSVGFNISRAIGPALGGVLIASVGIAAPFYLNAFSFTAVIFALLWWRPTLTKTTLLPSERLFGAIRRGLRYARESPPLRATLLRTTAFFLSAGSYWALMPLVAREQLNGGSSLYGLLLAGMGIGAVMGALVIPKIKAKVGIDKMVAIGTLATSLVIVGFALNRNPIAGIFIAMAGGAAWIMVLSTLNLSAQLALPEWVRARGLSIFLMVLFGSLALGSAIWGQIASHFGIPTALLISAACAALAVPLTWKWKLQPGSTIDFTSSSWAEPVVAGPIEDERGPVMITVEYLIDPKRSEEFLKIMDEVAPSRKRDGAFAWGVFEDAAKPGRYLEYFMTESWLEHLRQHERVTKSDQEMTMRIREFHIGKNKPVISHYIAPER